MAGHGGGIVGAGGVGHSWRGIHVNSKLLAVWVWMSPCNIQRSCILFHEGESGEGFICVYTMKDTYISRVVKLILHCEWHCLYILLCYTVQTCNNIHMHACIYTTN